VSRPLGRRFPGTSGCEGMRSRSISLPGCPQDLPAQGQAPMDEQLRRDAEQEHLPPGVSPSPPSPGTGHQRGPDCSRGQAAQLCSATAARAGVRAMWGTVFAWFGEEALRSDAR